MQFSDRNLTQFSSFAPTRVGYLKETRNHKLITAVHLLHFCLIDIKRMKHDFFKILKTKKNFSLFYLNVVNVCVVSAKDNLACFSASVTNFHGILNYILQTLAASSELRPQSRIQAKRQIQYWKRAWSAIVRCTKISSISRIFVLTRANLAVIIDKHIIQGVPKRCPSLKVQ